MKTRPKLYSLLLPGVLLFAIFSISALQAAVLRVPGDATGIQRAIDASRNGDTILVSPGVYTENIIFKGRAVTLTSTNPADPQVVNATIIRAPGRGSAVTFTNAETSNSVLSGFTISGGYGTVNTLFGATIVWGGGIYCYRSAPAIVGNTIKANFAPPGTNDIAGYGAGVGLIEASPLIARNLITGNDGFGGSGILAYLGQAKIVSNLILSNSASVGGGVVLISGSEFRNNTVARNRAQIAGNVYAVSDSFGSCFIRDNIICNAISGGGLYIETPEELTLTTFNNVWNNAGGEYAGTNQTGVNGNISQDPLFIDDAQNDYRLRDLSPCINAGDPDLLPIAGELDFYRGARHYAGRIDIGAHEYSDNFRPLAEAGPHQVIRVLTLPETVALDGSASSDPNGLPISYQWTQVSGPAGTFVDPNVSKPTFAVGQLGDYSFQLIVYNGSFYSYADLVKVTVKNDPPTAYAGDDQLFSDEQPIASVTLDGSRSSDPEQVALNYRWKQVGGWNVSLDDPRAARPTFLHPWPGVYLFELVVNDGLQDSPPDVVAVVIGPNNPPVANAGPGRYVASGSVTLDGTGSSDPDGYGTLSYQWKQVSGAAVTLSGTNTPTPVVSGLVARTTIQRFVFELRVSDGTLTSPPSTVTVTVVPNYGSNALVLYNPPFNPERPTIVAFGGGNCTTGSGLGFGGVWEEQANWISVDAYGPSYTRYGDMLMVYLSAAAPNYRRPIQAIGFSTGNLPAMEVAWYVNVTYKDARYAVNRVSLLDAVCSHLGVRVAQYHTNRVAGEQGWVDNYISNDANYSRRPVIAGALNVVCNPPRAHFYPVQRYYLSSLQYTNGGLVAFGYLSVIGDGRNYQLNTASQKYYFNINASEAIVQFTPTVNPGKILAPVHLQGPTNGGTLSSNGVTLNCAPVENAVGYQLLFGADPDRVMDYTMVSDTTNPPNRLVTGLPYEHTWWTVRAYDQFGSTIHADPLLIQRPANHAPVVNAGVDQVIYAGLEGTALVTLTGGQSSDPDGDALSYTWAWAIGDRIYQSNAVSFTLELPIGEHVLQLMVDDGRVRSGPDEVKIKVVAPLKYVVRIAPTTINLRSQGQHILATIQFSDGLTSADVDGNAPLLLSPGDIPEMKRWTAGDQDQTSLFAFFDRSKLAGQVQNGTVQLTIAGRFKSGQWFYGRDTVRIIGER
jgi:hypothetical protein